jgi:hypothetical protein
MGIKRALFIFLVIFIFIIFSLETLSKIYKCETSIPLSACPIIIKEENKLLSDLRNKRLAGEKISKEEYRQVADKIILEVDPDLIGGYYNGITCDNMGYVRNDLPKEAKKYVKRHELEHLLQTGEERNPEFSASFAGAKEYPRGVIQTVLFSLKTRVKYYDSPTCYLLTLWELFKIYFLPF